MTINNHSTSTKMTPPLPPPSSSTARSVSGEGATKSKSNNASAGGTASAMSTAFNTIKGIMGVGILTVPWSMSQIGTFPSLLLLSAACLVSSACWALLCVLCAVYGVYSYRDLALILFGRRMASFVDVVLLVFLYFVCTLYVIFVTEVLPHCFTVYPLSVLYSISPDSKLQCLSPLKMCIVLFTSVRGGGSVHFRSDGDRRCSDPRFNPTDRVAVSGRCRAISTVHRHGGCLWSAVPTLFTATAGLSQIFLFLRHCRLVCW